MLIVQNWIGKGSCRQTIILINKTCTSHIAGNLLMAEFDYVLSLRTEKNMGMFSHSPRLASDFSSTFAKHNSHSPKQKVGVI